MKVFELLNEVHDLDNTTATLQAVATELRRSVPSEYRADEQTVSDDHVRIRLSPNIKDPDLNFTDAIKKTFDDYESDTIGGVFKKVKYNGQTVDGHLLGDIFVWIEKQYINVVNLHVTDEYTEELKPELREALMRVKKDCGAFLKESNGQMIYSGRGKGNKAISLMDFKHHTDRRPTNTALGVHYLFDILFQQKFGVKFRSNALFVTGDLTFAAGYGTPYAVFPKGDYKYSWSEEVRDLFEQTEMDIPDLPFLEDFWGYMGHNPNPTRKMVVDAVKNMDKMDKIQLFDYLDYLEYTDSDLVSGIQSENEIMVHAPNGMHLINFKEMQYSLAEVKKILYS
jgi:hypothetical protein